MSMNFFDFPAEIRLQIYEELLVLSEPVLFMTSWNKLNKRPFLQLQKRYGLCPALLRASKSVYHEASPLLYSRNRFDFTDLASRGRLSALTSFFNQTGDKNASFIRHLCIDFLGYPDLKEDSIRTLELIREKCTNITIFETLRTPQGDLVTKEVIVHIHSHKVPSYYLYKKIRDCGWTVNITIILESEKSVELEDDLDGVDEDIDNYIAMFEESEEGIRIFERSRYTES
ncbi:hypothetical protein V8E54_013189 [Elaphomyces granulatus]